MKLVWVAPYYFEPLIHGGRIRLFHLIRSGLQAGHTIELWSIGEGAPAAAPQVGLKVIRFDNRSKVGRTGKARSLLSPLPSWAWLCTRHDVRESLARRLNGAVDAVVLDELHTQAYGVCVPDRVPIVSSLYNIEWKATQDLADRADELPRRLRLSLEARKLRRLERRAIARASCVVAVSASDGAYLVDANAARVCVAPNGVDTSYFAPPLNVDPGSRSVVMTAHFGHPPNEAGARWLVEEVLPVVWRREPHVQVRFVGAQPRDWMVALAAHDHRVNVTGEVLDVRPYLSACAAAVVPLLSGGGTSLKVAEALAVGLPVVSTKVGGRGYPLVERKLGYVADSAVDFADGILQAFSEINSSPAARANRRDYARQYLDWQVTTEPLVRELQRIASGGALQRGRRTRT